MSEVKKAYHKFVQFTVKEKKKFKDLIESGHSIYIVRSADDDDFSLGEVLRSEFGPVVVADKFKVKKLKDHPVAGKLLEDHKEEFTSSKMNVFELVAPSNNFVDFDTDINYRHADLQHRLVKIANRLDLVGRIDLANEIDYIIKTIGLGK